jgi:hypothetical protein
MLRNLLSWIGQQARNFLVSQPPLFTLGYRPGDTPPKVKDSSLQVTVLKPNGRKETLAFYFDRPELLHWENRPMLREIFRQIQGLGYKPESLTLRTPKRVYTYWALAPA